MIRRTGEKVDEGWERYGHVSDLLCSIASEVEIMDLVYIFLAIEPNFCQRECHRQTAGLEISIFPRFRS
jgi:hypothetical protein